VENRMGGRSAPTTVNSSVRTREYLVPPPATAASMVRAAVTTPGKSGNDTLQAEGPACTMAM